MSEDDNHSGLMFWIRSLAVSIVILAVTFALLISYLAEIKGNTAAVLARTESVAQHLNTLDAEILLIHNRIMEQKVPVAAPVVATEHAPTAQPEAAPAPTPESGASVTVPVPAVSVPPAAGALPNVQAPALSAPTVAPSKP
jgi:hypothetical protein